MTQKTSHAGFTLLETILSLALMALIVGMFSTLGKQWLIDWNIGSKRVQELEQIELAKNRIIDDLQAALNLPAVNTSRDVNFIGEATRVTFVREPRAHEGTDHLVIVQYNSDPDNGVTRRLALYDGVTAFNLITFQDPVSLLPSSYQIGFTYRNSEVPEAQSWREPMPPESILIKLMRGDGTLASSASVATRTSVPFSCATNTSAMDCLSHRSEEKSKGQDKNFLGSVKSVIKGPGMP